LSFAPFISEYQQFIRAGTVVERKLWLLIPTSKKTLSTWETYQIEDHDTILALGCPVDIAVGIYLE
jgi:hypothetical protein